MDEFSFFWWLLHPLQVRLHVSDEPFENFENLQAKDEKNLIVSFSLIYCIKCNLQGVSVSLPGLPVSLPAPFRGTVHTLHQGHFDQHVHDFDQQENREKGQLSPVEGLIFILLFFHKYFFHKFKPIQHIYCLG